MASQIRSHLDRELRDIQDDLLRLGSMLNTTISRALQSLASRDIALARQIVADDAEINALRFHIEEQCVHVIATQQPAASDLRAIVAAMNIVGDLERMADECRDMTTRALDAYVARDAEMARAVAARDDIIDELYQQIFRELLTFMLEDQHTISRALYLLFAAHNLERIGDRAVNIAERVIFLTSGEMKELNAGPLAPV